MARAESMPYAKSQEAALIVLRAITGIIFIHAGAVKWSFWSAVPEGVPAGMAVLMQFLSITEPLGGLALIAGFLTRWAAAGLTIILIGAIFVLQFALKVGFSLPQGPGWNFPLAVLAGCLILLAFGAGRWSLDAMRARAR